MEEVAVAALTGRSDGRPLPPPPGLVPKLRAVAADIERLSGVVVDPVATLVERAAILGLTRGGTTSCGGSCRLLRVGDGWIAASLPRPSDIELLPAWLGVEAGDDPWSAVAIAVANGRAAEVEADGALLGLAVARLPTTVPTMAAGCVAHRVGDARATTSLADVVVVDLSALWAGPLCGALLADTGATVVKLETTTRPDGARFGPPAFFERLNGRKRFRLVEPGEVLSVVADADVVIEASRPRALRQLGVDATELLRRGRPRVWISITGHGREHDRIAFGDDAAVAGGLVAWEDGEPRFCADAVADPATGLTAAAACLEALSVGGRWLLDVALARVAAGLARP